ncbi:MAG TPA: M23 family metallopeptidase, partial [Candidatus Sumerlaeota bacterium]|nr:M23 family metallopeptidase [Candidatus Sumerlaeota bacterium]
MNSRPTLPQLFRMRLAMLVVVFLVLCVANAWAGFYHTVRPGETLQSIAGKYGVSTAMIKMSNQLSGSPTLSVGTKLWIEGRPASPALPGRSHSVPTSPARSRITPYPGTTSRPIIHKMPAPPPPSSSSRHILSLSTKTSLPKSSSRSSAPPPRSSRSQSEEISKPSAPSSGTRSRATKPSDLEGPKDDDSAMMDVPGGGRAIAPPPPPVYSPQKGSSIKPSKAGYIWPVEGRVTRRFASRADEKYSGIDISVPRGTEVRAAGEGKVVYASDRIPAYGRMVIIQHDGGYATCYGQNSQLLVHEG